LTGIESPENWKVVFEYDGLGRRRITRDYNWNSQTEQWTPSAETRYVYDRMLVKQERSSGNAPVKTYTRGLDLSGSFQGAGGIGGMLAMTVHSGTDAGSYFYHADRAGNITAMMDSGGTIVAQYLYDAFGNQIGQWGVDNKADLNTYRFSSKEVHARSGLYYYGYRYYSPSYQRWLNQDPIGEAGGLNLYQFNYNNPQNIVDPFGLFGDGRTYGPEYFISAPLGHSDMYGADRFDFVRFDHRKLTHPYNIFTGTGYHFQNWKQSFNEVNQAISKGDKAAFEDSMHRLQDYWSHCKKGYSFRPGLIWFYLNHLRVPFSLDAVNPAGRYF
jgi:RHS repeat-associated protein